MKGKERKRYFGVKSNEREEAVGWHCACPSFGHRFCTHVVQLLSQFFVDSSLTQTFV
jgi:hypothetical protein